MLELIKTDCWVVDINWTKIQGTIGYQIRHGTSKDKLNQNYQALGTNSLTIRSLNALQKYYFTIDAFNENGIIKGKNIIEID